MRIAIEAQRIFRSNKHGMDFVILEAIKELQFIDRQNEYYIFVSPGDDCCLQSTSNFHIVELKCPTYALWEQYALPVAVGRVKADILHCTSNTAPIFCRVPIMVTLHDIIFLEKRHGKSSSMYQTLGWYYRRFVVPKILSKCRKIITVSNSECNRIKENLNLDQHKIVAIYNGYSNHFRPIEDPYQVTKKYLEERDYIFFLGNTDPKKNTIRTLQAYGLYLESSAKRLPLLIADIKEQTVEQMLTTAEFAQIRPYLRFSGYINNTDLPSIYSGASTFLYTSLRESFGIPILESMACGTPLITSKTSSMPEIAGEGAVLIDPTSAIEIADRILALESDQALREAQIAYGLERVKLFSWRHTAQNMLDIYREVING